MVGGHMTIFSDVKDALGINRDDQAFNTRIKLHLDTELATLGQLGVFEEDIKIDPEQMSWDDLDNLSRKPGSQYFTMVKNFILLRTILVFDPPMGSVLSHQQGITKELSWRIREIYFSQGVNDGSKTTT